MPLLASIGLFYAAAHFELSAMCDPSSLQAQEQVRSFINGMVPRAQRVSAITPAVKKAQKAGAAVAPGPRGSSGGGSAPAAPAPARSAKLPALKKGTGPLGASTRGGGYDMVTIAEEGEGN